MKGKKVDHRDQYLEGLVFMGMIAVALILYLFFAPRYGAVGDVKMSEPVNVSNDRVMEGYSPDIDPNSWVEGNSY